MRWLCSCGFKTTVARKAFLHRDGTPQHQVAPQERVTAVELAECLLNERGEIVGVVFTEEIPIEEARRRYRIDTPARMPRLGTNYNPDGNTWS